ncbi:MAG: hypothetical protein ACKO9Q_23005, partial [Pirellula sp.]
GEASKALQIHGFLSLQKTAVKNNFRVFGKYSPLQLNKGNQTQFDPPVIATGRRLKTSACLRFTTLLPMFFGVFDSRILPESGPLLAKFR